MLMLGVGVTYVSFLFGSENYADKYYEVEFAPLMFLFCFEVKFRYTIK